MKVQATTFWACAVSAATQLHAGRPLITDDAGTVSPGDFEFEAGVTWHRDSQVDDFELPFSVTAGLFSTLEAGIGFGSAIQERYEAAGTEVISGVGDLALGAKWNPLPEDRYWASHALAFTTKLPTASTRKDIGTGEVDYDLTYIASKSLSETWSAHLNVGYTWTGDPDESAEADILHAGMATGWYVVPEVELVAEVFADLPEARAEDGIVQVNGGLRWGVTGTLILDAAIGTKLRNEAPDLTATIGLTWTWEGMHRKNSGPSASPTPISE